MNDNVAKNFYFLVISLSILYNYFNDTKLFNKIIFRSVSNWIFRYFS